ncbi:MAG: hypothetical protein SPH45_09935, partial [Gemmiger qucibialis]|nr:hypothetical protein [Gemmiger qucibialis]
CPCFGSLFPPLAALTFAASSIICAFGLASAAPRSPYRHLELCGIALNHTSPPARILHQRCGFYIFYTAHPKMRRKERKFSRFLYFSYITQISCTPQGELV